MHTAQFPMQGAQSPANTKYPLTHELQFVSLLQVKQLVLQTPHFLSVLTNQPEEQAVHVFASSQAVQPEIATVQFWHAF